MNKQYKEQDLFAENNSKDKIININQAAVTVSSTHSTPMDLKRKEPGKSRDNEKEEEYEIY